VIWHAKIPTCFEFVNLVANLLLQIMRAGHPQFRPRILSEERVDRIDIVDRNEILMQVNTDGSSMYRHPVIEDTHERRRSTFEHPIELPTYRSGLVGSPSESITSG
jgi:hypothetical protein